MALSPDSLQWAVAVHFMHEQAPVCRCRRCMVFALQAMVIDFEKRKLCQHVSMTGDRGFYGVLVVMQTPCEFQTTRAVIFLHCSCILVPLSSDTTSNPEQMSDHLFGGKSQLWRGSTMTINATTITILASSTPLSLDGSCHRTSGWFKVCMHPWINHGPAILLSYQYCAWKV